MISESGWGCDYELEFEQEDLLRHSLQLIQAEQLSVSGERLYLSNG